MARDRWVASWWPRVYRMALAMTGREQDAEDLAQETLMAGLAALARFRGDSSESTWLYAILLRKHLSQKRRPPAPLRPVRVEREPVVEEALALLADLPPEQKITATLFYVEAMSIREIARALGVLGPTVRWRLYRVRQTLKRKLGSDAPRIMCKELF
jgi:RNA polymerase sigma-70 factor (ECF subfamily)